MTKEWTVTTRDAEEVLYGATRGEIREAAEEFWQAHLGKVLPRETEFVEGVQVPEFHIEFAAKYTLLSAPSGGESFMPHGPDFAVVRETAAADPARVWSVIDDGYGVLWVSSGMHVVNLLHFLITREPCRPGEETVDYLY